MQPSSFLNGKNLHNPEYGVWKQKCPPYPQGRKPGEDSGGYTAPLQLSRPWLTALGLPGGAENLFPEA